MNPLDQLADITPPSHVDIWPLAWGYWVAIIIVLGLVIATIHHLLKIRKRTAVKRQTIAKVKQMQADAPYFNHKIQVQLKLFCTHYYGADMPHTLSGKAWSEFLMSKYKGANNTAINDSIDQVHSALYANAKLADLPLTPEAVQASLIEWLTKAAITPSSSQSISEQAPKEQANV